MNKKLGAGMKILSILLGALLGGFMWRCRGDGGWGSSWGLYAVGMVLMLLIYHFYSDRSGMKLEMIPFGAFLLGLGVTGYATVIEQLGGVLWSDLPYVGFELLNGQQPVSVGPNGDVNVPIDPVSGGIIIFIMGFTLVPLFTVFVTSLFSNKKYKLKDYVIICVIFFAVSLVIRATVAHPILKAINPEQVQYAALGLKAYGHDYSSPMAAYMSHFQNRSWTQEIPFFENYYMSIEHISDAFGVLGVSAYVLIKNKDKYTAFGSLIIDFFTAAATTALSPLISCWYHAGPFAAVKPPEWFLRIADWGVWEFGTGFCFAFFLMTFLALTADRKNTARTGFDDTPLFNDKKISFAVNLVAFVFIFCVAPARVFGSRFAEVLETFKILPDKEPLATILIVVGSIALGIITLKILRKNILEKGGNAADMLPVDFAKKALPIYMVFCFICYFFMDDCEILYFKNDVTVPLMLVTFALIVLLYIPVRIKLKKGLKAAGDR